MEEMKALNIELQKLDDVVEDIRYKIHNAVGFLGLAHSGMMKLNSEDDSFELSAISMIRDYLKAVEKQEIVSLHEKLEELKSLTRT